MILVDTSVWIDYFNDTTTEQTSLLDSLLYDGMVVMGDLIFLEILQGFRLDKQYELARQKLGKLECYELFGSAMILPCAQNYRVLRKRGITVRKTPDVIIASYCIKHAIPLLFSDRDFSPFVQHLGLVDAVTSKI